ncbi:BTB domain-containing protein [Aphelenchoides fujianensis]|nr:BTB domain-containing protein [Aphelenchoides fujianensis]
MTLNRDGTLCSTMDEGAEVVQLNVGGTRFATTKATLISREPESFFAQLLQMDELGELPDPWRSAACRLDSGAYFIDRDGDLFAYVLDYLRNGKLLLPANFHEIARLREETLFYQLVGMNQQLLPYFSIRYPTKNAVGYTNGSAGVLSALETAFS